MREFIVIEEETQWNLHSMRAHHERRARHLNVRPARANQPHRTRIPSDLGSDMCTSTTSCELRAAGTV